MEFVQLMFVQLWIFVVIIDFIWHKEKPHHLRRGFVVSIESRWQDSNLRPPAPKAGALTTILGS